MRHELRKVDLSEWPGGSSWGLDLVRAVVGELSSCRVAPDDTSRCCRRDSSRTRHRQTARSQISDHESTMLTFLFTACSSCSNPQHLTWRQTAPDRRHLLYRYSYLFLPVHSNHAGSAWVTKSPRLDSLLTFVCVWVKFLETTVTLSNKLQNTNKAKTCQSVVYSFIFS